jgi:hypothetical protein
VASEVGTAVTTAWVGLAVAAAAVAVAAGAGVVMPSDGLAVVGADEGLLTDTQAPANNTTVRPITSSLATLVSPLCCAESRNAIRLEVRCC